MKALGASAGKKISPLGGIPTIERLLDVSEPHRFISGFMYNLPPGKPATLTTPSAVWSKWPGAVSGKPFAPLADLCIGETYRRMDRRRYQIVGSGAPGTALLVAAARRREQVAVDAAADYGEVAETGGLANEAALLVGCLHRMPFGSPFSIHEHLRLSVHLKMKALWAGLPPLHKPRFG